MDAPIPLEVLLNRSSDLLKALMADVGQGHYRLFEESPRLTTSVQACNLALEHGVAVTTLVAGALHVSAIAVLRLQYEALLRGAWLLYAAKDPDIALLAALLTSEAANVAGKRAVSAGDMLKALERAACPVSLKSLLREFRDQSWEALNSYVHGGLHALTRSTTGVPAPLAIQAVRMSNGLSHLAAMLVATLAGRQDWVNRLTSIPNRFGDCLPMASDPG